MNLETGETLIWKQNEEIRIWFGHVWPLKINNVRRLKRINKNYRQLKKKSSIDQFLLSAAMELKVLKFISPP